MNKIKISKIVVKENIRKDMGDLTELSNSIKENGVRQPIELNSKNELIDGHRRLKAAKAAGWKEIPYFVSDEKIDITTSQLIAGLFGKNLYPIEEGKAFRKYIDENDITVGTLAVKISKSEAYVNKRIALLTLPEDVKTALIKKKIQLGHALLLAKMPKNDAAGFLKEIERQDYSVAATKSALGYHEQSKTLSEAKFSTANCKTCKHNGSVQSELFETGKTLTGKCLNPGCFNKKTADFVKEAKTEFKDVLFKPKVTKTEYGEKVQSSPDGFVQGDHDYDCSNKGVTDAYKKKLRKERNPENFIVSVEDDGEIIEFFKPPKSKAGPTDEKGRATSRADKLKVKISIYRREQTIEISQKKLKIGLDLKSLVLWHLTMKFDPDKIWSNEKKAKMIFETDGNILDKDIKEMALNIFEEMEDDSLKVAAEKIGLSWKDDFVMSEEYLNNYTKAGMIKLAKELKIDVSDCKKNHDFSFRIVEKWKKGQVPKILGV